MAWCRWNEHENTREREKQRGRERGEKGYEDRDGKSEKIGRERGKRETENGERDERTMLKVVR